MRWPFLFLGISLSMTLAGWSLIPPDFYLRRTQVVQWLPYQDVAQLHGWIPQQSVLLSPKDFMDRLHQKFSLNSVAWTFYAGWSYLDLLEQTLQAYDQRKDVLERAQELFEQYRGRAHEQLRLNQEVANPVVLELEGPTTQPSLEENEKFLRVFRPLPWPDQGFNRAQVLQLLEACDEDQKRVEQQLNNLESARKNFADHHAGWVEWLSDLAQASQKYTQSDYLKGFDDPLPLPPP